MSNIYSTSVTVASFIEEIRRVITDPDRIEFTDDEIISYLNDALRAVFSGLIIRRIPLLVKKTTVSSFPYELPERFGGVYAITDMEGNEALLISPDEAERASSFSFYLLDNSLYVVPEQEVVLYYYELPLLTSTEDAIPYYHIIGSGLKWFTVKMLFMKMEMKTPDETELTAFFNGLAERMAVLLPQKVKTTRVRNGVQS